MTTSFQKSVLILIVSLTLIFTGNILSAVADSPATSTISGSSLTPEIQVQESWVDYQFEVGIPMVVKAGTKLQAGSLPQYVSMLIYNVIFPVSGILGFIMIIWAGVEYMIAGGNIEHQKAAQQKIIDALAGLLLLFAFWIILNTINPNILKLPDIGLIMAKYLGLDPGSFGQASLADLIGALIDKEVIWGSQDDYMWDGVKEGANEGATRKDLLDKAKNRCIDPMKNSTNIKGNCIDKIGWDTIKSDDCAPGTITINDNLLEILYSILQPNFTITCNGTKRTTKEYLQHCNFVIGPFVSDHNYCDNPNSKHKDGKAFDLEADPDTDLGGINQEFCDNALAKLLCFKPRQYGCRWMAIQSIQTRVCYERNSKTGKVHFHIEVP